MVKIKSEKIKIGKLIRCKKQFSKLLTPGVDYEILDILDENIKILDNDNDIKVPLSVSLLKEDRMSIFDYFIVF